MQFDLILKYRADLIEKRMVQAKERDSQVWGMIETIEKLLADGESVELMKEKLNESMAVWKEEKVRKPTE